MERRRYDWKVVLPNSVGISLALYVFMADSLRVIDGGLPAWRMMLPTKFNWPLFAFALLLMASPVIQRAIQLSSRRVSTITATAQESRKMRQPG
jgi:hypothetical protein